MALTEPVDVSAIMVNWNTKDLVLASLRHLYGTAKNLSMEVFVVDNGSSDGSVEMIRVAFPRVILIENNKNLGFARASNQALRRATGKYILLLNTDVMVREDTVVTLVDFMEKTPRAGVAGAQLLDPDGRKQNSFDNFPSLVTEGLNKSLLRILFPARFPSKRIPLSEPVAVESVLGACMMVRGKAVGDVGLMDEDYFFFLEETDWCYRMRARGWGVYVVPQSQAVHFQGGTASRVKALARVEYYRSRYLFFKKNRSPLQARVLGVILVVKLVVALAVQSLYCLATFFRQERARRKLETTWMLLAWHVRLCPDKGGLKESRA